MENETPDLDVKPAGNKDLWLFLVIVDIVLLCVFGFFIYNHFCAGLFQLRAPAEETAAVSDGNATPEVISVPQAPAPQEEPAPEVPVLEVQEISVAQVLAQEAKAAEKAAAEQSQATAQEQPATTEPAKESIIIEKNPKSKYRKVTFRWYGEGEKVALVSGFTNRKPQALTQKAEYWEITLSISPGTYKFLYVIDGKNRRDPYSPEQDGRSVVVVE